VINATINTLTERFLRDEKIRMLSSSVVYLSFAIFNTFDNKKGVIKIVVYSSVIDINQMDVILFAMIITSGLERVYEGCFTRFDQIITVSFKTAFATYLLENAILMLSRGKAFGHFLSPTVRHLQKQQNKCPTNARGDVHP